VAGLFGYLQLFGSSIKFYSDHPTSNYLPVPQPLGRQFLGHTLTLEANVYSVTPETVRQPSQNS